jgi:hypothetical protein
MMDKVIAAFFEDEIAKCNERIETIENIMRTQPGDMKIGDPQNVRLALRRGDWQRYRDGLQSVLRDKPRLVMYWGADIPI